MRDVMVITLLTATIALGACKRDAVRETAPEAPAAEPATPSDVDQRGLAPGAEVDARTEAERKLLAQRVIYFDFDNAEVRPEFRDVVAAHARYLSRNSSAKVRLEGHADERGSREYNIGLGERRAQSVRRALMLQGSGDGQLVTVSYGEERPAAVGSDEASWAKNRRVELIYGN